MTLRLSVARLLPLAVLALAPVAGCEDCSKGGGGAGDAAEGGASITLDAASSTDGGVINVTPVPTASVAAMLNPEKLPAYTGPTGSIEGTISVTGEPPLALDRDFGKCPDGVKTFGRAFREGPPMGEKGARALADAVVVVTGYRGFYIPEKHEAKELRIEGCGYTTRTATMTFGQRIEVKNLTRDFWTPVLEPGTNMVLMMAPPNGGDPAKIYPKKPGHYVLLDRDRKYVVVDVYTFLHPLHASTDTAGHFRIDGLPAGKLKLSTMHPQIADSAAEQEITVEAGVVQKIELLLKNVNRDAGAPGAAPAADTGYRPPVR